MSDLIKRRETIKAFETTDIFDEEELEYIEEIINDVPDADNDSNYNEYIEEKKIECFNYILDVFNDTELHHQKKASMIIRAIKEYKSYRAY